MPSGKIKWVGLMLLLMLAAGVTSIVSKVAFSLVRHGVFLLLILFFLASCAWHLLQIDKARETGGRLILVAGRSGMHLLATVVVGLILAISLKFIIGLVLTESLSRAENVQYLLVALTAFFASLLVMVQIVEVRFYDRGVFARGQFLQWDDFDEIEWRVNGQGRLVLQQREKRAFGQCFYLTVRDDQVAKVGDLLAGTLREKLPVEEPGPERVISILP